MTGSRVRAFFHGAHFNLNVLREVNCVLEIGEVTRLAGSDTQIQPRANLVRADQTFVHGILPTGKPFGSFRP
jgi:hypothetical protein